MLKVVRFNTWWNAIVPQVLGWIYFCIGARRGWLDTGLNYPVVLFFFIALIGISSFGYLLNDYCDAETDLLAGKKNALAAFNKEARISFVILPLMAGAGVWYLLYGYAGLAATILLLLQVLALVLYSVPPVQLKYRGMAGVLTDAFYGHINPVLITLCTFQFLNFVTGYKLLLMAGIVICCTLKGLRNILLHQVEDRKKDRKAGIPTFVVRHGGLYTINLVNRLLLPEIIATVALVVTLAYLVPPVLIALLLFAAISYLKFSGWKLAYLPKRQLRFKFLYFMNDFYEGWLPLFFVLIVAAYHPQLSFLLILHVLLFPGFLLKLWNDLKTINQNFKTEEDY